MSLLGPIDHATVMMIVIMKQSSRRSLHITFFFLNFFMSIFSPISDVSFKNLTFNALF